MDNLKELTIRLFEPGMTHVHRVGLAGLYMSLKQCGFPKGNIGTLSYSLTEEAVHLSWKEDALKAFRELLTFSFGITQESPSGLVDFAGHRGMLAGDIQRIQLHKAVSGSYLQHNKHQRIPKGTPDRTIALNLDDHQVTETYRPFVAQYAHMDAAERLFTSEGNWKNHIQIEGWLFPGCAARHSGFGDATKVDEMPSHFLCLLFAPIASLYYRLHHRGSDGKFDSRRNTAVCFPHLQNLETYSRAYEKYLQSPVEQLFADGLGDAGLSALIALRAGDKLATLEIAGCTVLTMGKVGWNKQQQTRTGILSLETVDEAMLDQFETAVRCLKNRTVIKKPVPAKKGPAPKKGFFVSTSLVRGLAAENIAKGNDWFCGFRRLMKSRESARLIAFEREGVAQMVQEAQWSDQADIVLVQAVHAAVRNRYGALAARAKRRGERIRFDKEFERMRMGLMRAKNASTLRAELADLFARGGVNKTLQAEWQTIMPLFTGPDWQRTRDLALLALASYAGKGSKEIEEAEIGLEETEE